MGWAVVEWDPNQGHVRDIVSPSQAADIKIGDEIIAVVIEHKDVKAEFGRNQNTGLPIMHNFKQLNYGWAVRAKVLNKADVRDGLGVLIIAEPYDEDMPQEGTSS